MAVKVLELLVEHSGTVGLILGVPFLSLCYIINTLWKHNIKNQDRLARIIEQKVEVDTKLELALNSLTKVVEAKS